MTTEEYQRCLERLHTAFELFAAGLDMKRCQLKRQYPEATDTQIEKLLNVWLCDDRSRQAGPSPQPLSPTPPET